MVYRLYIYRPEYEDTGRPSYLDPVLVQEGLDRLAAEGPGGTHGVYRINVERGSGVIRPIFEQPGNRIAALTVKVTGGIEPEQDTAHNFAEILATGLGVVRIHDPQTDERFILRPAWWERLLALWREVTRGLNVRPAAAPVAR
ncbi:MAG: hypothetical protein IT307_10405 [Chloroflexi bacterium]|nr:hypothetical protein [Chloroflexota bacterium]